MSACAGLCMCTYVSAWLRQYVNLGVTMCLFVCVFADLCQYSQQLAKKEIMGQKGPTDSTAIASSSEHLRQSYSKTKKTKCVMQKVGTPVGTAKQGEETKRRETQG